jgi:ABC-2 type transport system permease protein
MQNVRAIFSKEFGSYFNSAIAYIAIMIFLMVTSYLFFFPQGFFVVAQAWLRPFFSLLPWTLLLFIPAVTMRLWAEEKKLGTIEVLMTLPVKDWEVVTGKFLAALGFYVIMLALTLTLPITVAFLGNPDWGPVVGGYVGALLLGAAYIAIGTFISSLTSEQIVAFIVTVVALLALLLIGVGGVLAFVPETLAGLFRYLSLSTHFDSIGRGVLDTRDVVYYLSVIGFFLFLTVRTVESRKWR